MTEAGALAFHQDMDSQNPAGVQLTDEQAAAAPIFPKDLRPISVIVCMSDPGCDGEDENCTTIVLETRDVDELTGEYRMVKIRLKPGQAIIFWSDLLHRGHGKVARERTHLDNQTASQIPHPVHAI